MFQKIFSNHCHARLLLALGLFLSFAFVGAPNVAHAVVQDECQDGNEIDEAVKSASAQVGKSLATAINNVVANYGSIDIEETHCLKRLKTFYDALLSLRIGVLDPFSFIMDLVIKQVFQILEQICNQVVQMIGSFKDYVLSQVNRICIPVPHLGVNITTPQFKNPSCQGVPVFSFSPAPDYTQWNDYDPTKMIKDK